MKKNALILVLLIISTLLVAGCQSTLTVHNAQKTDIVPIFKDYIGMHGYTIRYSNDKTGAYSVDMGTVYIPGASSATKSKSVVVQPSNSGTGQPMTAYEQTSWNTVNNPARYAQASAAVNIIQNGTDVVINIDTNDAGGTSLDDIKNYIQSLGYKVD